MNKPDEYYPEDGTPGRPPTHATRRDRLTTWIAVLIIFTVLAALAAPMIANYRRNGAVASQLCSARQIYLSLRNRATELAGSFPARIETDHESRLMETSNEALQSLVPRFLDDKAPFFNRRSAWCYRRVSGKGFEDRIYPGENDWAYVRGLTDQSFSRYPLLANAFAPGTVGYVEDASKPGGVWKGNTAVVVYAGGSAEIVLTRPAADGTHYIPRIDAPDLNAFEPLSDWLIGDDVKVLLPDSPDPKAIPAQAVLGTNSEC